MEVIERELMSTRTVEMKMAKMRTSQEVEAETDTVRRFLRMRKTNGGPEAGTGLNRLTMQTHQHPPPRIMYLLQVLARAELQHRDHGVSFNQKAEAKARTVTTPRTPVVPLLPAANLAALLITTTTLVIVNTMHSSKADTHLEEEALTLGSTILTLHGIPTRTTSRHQG